VTTFDVLLFASYADAAGAGSVRVSLPANARVSALVEAVRAAAPMIALPARPLVAVNHRYAAMDAALAAGDEVALIPPVAGG
jgi:molybdopterin converting factor subunit 1